MSCVVACIALEIVMVVSLLRGYLPALIYSRGQGYMKIPSRVLLESNYNLVG